MDFRTKCVFIFPREKEERIHKSQVFQALLHYNLLSLVLFANLHCTRVSLCSKPCTSNISPPRKFRFRSVEFKSEFGKENTDQVLRKAQLVLYYSPSNMETKEEKAVSHQLQYQHLRGLWANYIALHNIDYIHKTQHTLSVLFLCTTISIQTHLLSKHAHTIESTFTTPNYIAFSKDNLKWSNHIIFTTHTLKRFYSQK